MTFVVCVKIYALSQTHALYVGDLEPIYTIHVIIGLEAFLYKVVVRRMVQCISVL
jgi:hypothetical protein